MQGPLSPLACLLGKICLKNREARVERLHLECSGLEREWLIDAVLDEHLLRFYLRVNSLDLHLNRLS